MHPETYLPTDMYAALVDALVRALGLNQGLPAARRTSVAAALYRAGLISPTLACAFLSAEPCIYSGQFTPDLVRWALGEHDLWPKWIAEQNHRLTLR